MRYAIILCLLVVLFSFVGAAEDWPAYRHDNARSAVTAEQIPLPLSPHWVFDSGHAPEPAWPEEGKEKSRVRFDEAYYVAAAGDALYFASSADDKVYCLDAATGDVRWAAFAAGPIRVAPTIVAGRVYVGSDDGYAYCLNAADGAIVWKTRAAIRDDKVLGNGRMISLWPIRTGVLVDKGIAYFGAGVFPHEGLFLCAVNADDGKLIWRNDSFGQQGYKLEYGGISPQGPLLLSADKVFVPSGRSMPAAFDRADGAFQYYADPDGHVGGCWALLTDDRIVAGVGTKTEYDQQRGKRTEDTAYAWFPGTDLVVAPDYAYIVTFDDLMSLDRKAFKGASEARAKVMGAEEILNNELRNLDKMRHITPEEKEALKAHEEALKKQIGELEVQRRQAEESVSRWKRACVLNDSLLLAGGTLFVGGKGAVKAVNTATGDDTWTAPVDGRACGLAAANGRLYVSTDKGKIYSFGAGPADLKEVNRAPSAAPFPADQFGNLCAKAADEIVATSGVTKGYCLVLGSGTGRLAYELAKRTELKVVAVEPDEQKADAARKALDAAGVYGTRVAVDQYALDRLPYADYFANLIVSETMLTADVSKDAVDGALRFAKPHGGVALLGRPSGAKPVEAPPAAHQDGFVAEAKENWLKTTRGALPGEGKWTHEYGDPGNTACSDDERVKGALGVLWFGRPGPDLMVERHARPAAPVAGDGRMFVQGENVVMAYDAYNGTRLWERPLPGALRVRVDSDMGDLALESDGLYIATADKCQRLNPATGETMRTYDLPPHGDKARRWGYLACSGHLLFGSIAAPLKEDYGALWRDIVDENGDWGDIDAAAAKRGIKRGEWSDADELKGRFPKPDVRAFWEAEQSGMMWHSMNNWPAWGSVTAPEGAVTDRIMASDCLFALDTETGATMWKYDGKVIAHPAIAIGDGTIFLADCSASDDEKQAAMQQRQDLIQKGTWEKEGIQYGAKDADIRRVVALDMATGAKRWERVIDLTGCGGDRMGAAYKDGVLCFFGCFSNHDRNFFRDGKLAWRRITAVSGKDGTDLWSKPLNYLRRPVIVRDTILIEPRACDLHTGIIKTRLHPMTDEESTWEYVRPGHCCSATSAAPNMFFLRGGFLWYYDLGKDEGMLPFGAIRPGCWINVIPANGLVLFPEASAGCTCSYPIRSTVVLEPRKEDRTWATCVQHGKMTPVKHLAVNFGAPGDRRDNDGTLWFAYPHPPSTEWYDYGIKFALAEQFTGKSAYYARDPEGMALNGTDKPWVFSSGAKGLTSFTLPLLDEGQGPAKYTVRLYFAEPDQGTQRTFAVKLQDAVVLDKIELTRDAGPILKEFKGVKVDKGLRVELVPTGPDTPSVISGIEAIRENEKVAEK